MKYEEFEKWFNAILRFQKESEKANKAVQSLCSSSFAVFDVGADLFDNYIELLESCFSTSEGEWITYYVYDCDCGRSPKEVQVNDEKILLDSLEKLYKVLAI